MDVNYVKIETQSQKLFKDFLNGVTIPTSSCELVMEDLISDDRIPNYVGTMERVKRKLSFSVIKNVENVLFVTFNYLHAEEERPVLVRLLNMHYHGSMFIVVNMSELVYIPEGSKNTLTLNELSSWLSEVAEKHLARIKVSERKEKIDSFVSQVKSFFHLTKSPA